MSREVRIGVTLTGKIYAHAIRIARGKNQVVGEKNDYYVTLAQLEDILQYVAPDGGEQAVLDARRMVRPGDEPLA